jgi:hypothetical protein
MTLAKTKIKTIILVSNMFQIINNNSIQNKNNSIKNKSNVLINNNLLIINNTWNRIVR